MWSPTIPDEADPKYLALVEALADDIQSGRLSPGDQLPTHRDLANRLGIALGTVSRAYAAAESRGLVSGEVGRGTFVRSQAIGADEGAIEDEDPTLIDLSKSRLARTPGDQSVRRALARLASRPDLDRLLDFYQPAAGMARHRAAGASWVRRAGLEADPGRVIITNGAQHGATVVLASLTRPGDVVLAEELTYPGVKAIASLLSLQLQPLALDEHGIQPAAFADACRSGSVRALYCMPTLQNPTGRTMPLERRREIAEIATRHDVAVVEDDVYGFLPDRPLPPITTFAPTLSYYITSTSKSLAPGLRLGYVVAPAAKIDRVAGTIRATTWLTAPLLAELASQWIESGEADEMVRWKREETIARHALARRVLAPWMIEAAAGLQFLAPVARSVANRGVRHSGPGSRSRREPIRRVHGRAEERPVCGSGLPWRWNRTREIGGRLGTAGGAAP